MDNDRIAYHGGQALRRGWTTGSCAAAAAQAAAQLLLTGQAPAEIRLETPAGLTFTLPVEQPHREGEAAVCTVRKDAGDDPDVTNGVGIAAAVSRAASGVAIRGGAGVGRVTRPGLAMPVGEAAINPGPRAQITAALERRRRPAGIRADLPWSSQRKTERNWRGRPITATSAWSAAFRSSARAAWSSR